MAELIVSIAVLLVTFPPALSSARADTIQSLNGVPAEINGVVRALNGGGVANARVIMTTHAGKSFYSQTNPFGFFQFIGLSVGESYSFTVIHKRLQFESRTIVAAETNDLLFVAVPLRTKFALDDEFGSGGKVTTDFGANDRAHVILPQSSGKLVVVGSSNNRPAIAKYHSNGVLDETFGEGGKVISANFWMSIDQNMKPAAVQADDKIIVGGSTTQFDLALERRHPDGTIDTSFGDQGLVILDFASGSSDEVKAVAVQPDGKIIAVARVTLATFDTAIGVARFNIDGSIDRSFGVDGRAVANTPNLDDPRAVSIQPDGTIVICGISQNTRQMMVRLTTGGQPDTGFGINGIVIAVPTGLLGYDLAIQRDGKILGIGEGLARYQSDGAIDTAFNGPTGVIGIQNVELQAVALRNDGLILAAGRSFHIAGNGGDFGVGLIHPFTGSLIGRVDTDILSGYFEDPKDIFVQADGKILVAGFIASSSATDFAIVRYVNF